MGALFSFGVLAFVTGYVVGARAGRRPATEWTETGLHRRFDVSLRRRLLGKLGVR